MSETRKFQSCLINVFENFETNDGKRACAMPESYWTVSWAHFIILQIKNFEDILSYFSQGIFDILVSLQNKSFFQRFKQRKMKKVVFKIRRARGQAI